MNGTEFIVRIDHQGTVLQINGQKVPWGATPFKANPDFGQHLPAKVREHYGIEMGRRVMAKRPEGVPENAIPATVWVEFPGNERGIVHFGGGYAVRYPEKFVAERYGITLPEPEPEPTPESVIDSVTSGDDMYQILAALDEAGFEIVRKADFRVAVAPEGM